MSGVFIGAFRWTSGGSASIASLPGIARRRVAPALDASSVVGLATGATSAPFGSRPLRRALVTDWCGDQFLPQQRRPRAIAPRQTAPRSRRWLPLVMVLALVGAVGVPASDVAVAVRRLPLRRLAPGSLMKIGLRALMATIVSTPPLSWCPGRAAFSAGRLTLSFGRSDWPSAPSFCR